MKRINASSAHIAKRYARGFYEALANEEMARAQQELAEITALWQNEELLQIISSAVIAANCKKELLATLLMDRCSAKTLNLLNLLCDVDRVTLLPAIYQHFVKLLLDRQGQIAAHVTTALPLSEEQKARVVSTFSKMVGKQVVLTEVVDRQLLGGIVVKIEDKVYDGSLRAKLMRFSKYSFAP